MPFVSINSRDRHTVAKKTSMTTVLTLKEVIIASCIEQQHEISEDFFERYPRFLLRRLKDIIQHLERNTRMIENYRDKSLSTIDHFHKMKVYFTKKEDLLTMNTDFPLFLQKYEPNLGTIPPSRYHEQRLVDVSLESCKSVSTSMKISLTSTQF